MAAYSGIYCTEAEIDQKSGAGVSSDYTADMKTAAALQAESKINVATDKIWAVDATAFTALSAKLKYILSDIASSFIAKQAIGYNMSGYFADEALIMINMQDDSVIKGIEQLREQAAKDIMGV